jgi:hypothetical protein
MREVADAIGDLKSSRVGYTLVERDRLSRHPGVWLQ